MKHQPLRVGGLLLLLTALAQAQAITSYTLTIYSAGTATVIGTPTVLPITAFSCNQPQPTVTPPTNPTRVVLNDPVNAGMACIYQDPGTGPLSALPFGAAAYEGTLKATNSAATSGESARSLPFTHPGVAPPVPTGVRVVS
jgi:hypothetical protein